MVETLAEALRPEWIQEALAESGRASIRERLLHARFIVWLVILLRLFRRMSYANLLEKLAGTWWTSRRRGGGSEGDLVRRQDGHPGEPPH